MTTGDIKLKVKSADIHDSASANPTGVIADGQQLGLHIDHAVSTSNSCSSGDPADCTSIDLAFGFNNFFKATCLAGKCTLNSTVNTLIGGSGAISAGDAANTTFSGIGINDQDGDLAFAEGLFIP